ncbi:MAG: hypothetical protein IJD59_06840 [Clostridia bacterium]|nr:hypothetical protein [Clostridia bacterium]
MTVTREMGTKLPDTTMSSPVYVDVRKAPISLHGFCEPFRRVPDEIARATSEGVAQLSQNSTGGRIRFCTDSDYIVVHAELSEVSLTGNSSPVACSSFDIYLKEDGKQSFRGVYFPSQGKGKSYVESRLKFYNRERKDVTLYCPLNASLKEVYVGLREGSELLPASPYAYEKPIVFYGSSIVHGGGLRPSSPYPSIVSRRLDSEYINLGFGGNAKAEKVIMEYMAGLDMSVFVYDYDHNAPTLEHLRETHYEGYRIIREKNPDLPIVMASRPDYWTRNYTLEYYTVEDNEKRRRLIEENYLRAKAEGDSNVYFVDGSKIYPEEIRNECSSDGCHPSDLGYYFMANAFEAVLRPILEKEKTFGTSC